MPAAFKSVSREPIHSRPTPGQRRSTSAGRPFAIWTAFRTGTLGKPPLLFNPVCTRPAHCFTIPTMLDEAQQRQQLVRAVVASAVGTTIEWYDFFLYGIADALVFPQKFFPQSDPFTGTLLSFTTYFVGFAARPVGAAIFGHFGDRIDLCQIESGRPRRKDAGFRSATPQLARSDSHRPSADRPADAVLHLYALRPHLRHHSAWLQPHAASELCDDPVLVSMGTIPLFGYLSDRSRRQRLARTIASAHDSDTEVRSRDDRDEL